MLNFFKKSKGEKMKAKTFIIAISVIPVVVFFYGCSVPTAKPYQPPQYKTVPKTLSIEDIEDRRVNEEHKQDFPNLNPLNQQLTNRFIQSQMFARVNQESKSTYKDDYILSSQLIDYGMDKHMTFWTVFPDALFAAGFTGLGIAASSPRLVYVGILVAGIDFLINGLGGKRMYEHDYIVSILLHLKDKSMSTLWKDTLTCKVSYVFTHWYWYFFTSSRGTRTFYENDVDYINKVVLDGLTDIIIENSLSKIAEIVGTTTTSLYQEEIKEPIRKYAFTHNGLVEIEIKLINK